MSDERDPDTDQQLPEVNDKPFVQDLVIADVEARKALGLKKYGTLLQAGNGRNMLLDAYEEALDLCIYLRGALEEQREAERKKYPLLKVEGETLWPLGDPDSWCTCADPVPSFTGFDFPVCAKCMSRVPNMNPAPER